MTVVYHEADANPSLLDGKRVSLIGYGHLGRPLAWNLRDSGIAVTIGVRDLENENARLARDDGFAVADIGDAMRQADIAFLLLADDALPDVFVHEIAPQLRRGQTLVFASGYNLKYGLVEPPTLVDVGVLAPRSMPDMVRQSYQDGSGFYCMMSVHQDITGGCREQLLALAHALGALKAGVVELTTAQETELDLFLQQAILPAVAHLLLRAGELLMGYGYPVEAVILDLYISGELNDFILRASQEGLLHALSQATRTAQYGFLSRMERMKDLDIDRFLEGILRELRGDTFVREWTKDVQAGYTRLNALLREQRNNNLWQKEEETIAALRGDN